MNTADQYLKTIYALQRANDSPASTGAIADRLGVRPASANEMIGKSADRGLVTGYVTTGGVSDGALNGFLTTVIGGLVILGALAVLGTLVAGLVGLSVTLFALFVLALSGVPGAVGGYPGAWYKGRGTARKAGRVAPRRANRRSLFLVTPRSRCCSSA